MAERRQCGVCGKGYNVNGCDICFIRLPSEKGSREICHKCWKRIRRVVKVRPPETGGTKDDLRSHETVSLQ